MDQVKAMSLAKQIGECFKRSLIAIPLVHKYPHQGITQRSGLRAATLEFDTAAFPNIEYIAGTRMSIYPPNSASDVEHIMSKLTDDFVHSDYPASRAQSPANATLATTNKRQKTVSVFEPVVKFGLKQSLAHLFDLTSAPTPEVLRVLSEFAKSRVQRELLLEASKSAEAYEKWLTGSSGELRTLRHVLDEFCGQVSARALLSVLPLQSARQYSVSSIKSTKRFRTEIIVVQHKFSAAQIAAKLQLTKEAAAGPLSPLASPASQQSAVAKPLESMHESRGSKRSLNSLRSLAVQAASPISMHQVKRVPSFSGPLISRYASSASSFNKRASHQQHQQHQHPQQAAHTRQSSQKPFNGLCSTYLLNLEPNKDYVICEFVENPRFTLKGNRERPILMIGQDIGVVAFRAFWQQRSLEFDRAQVFYTLFKDLAPKKFGEMHLVTLGGSRVRVEELFWREINAMLASKILASSATVNRASLLQLLHDATATSGSPSSATNTSDSPRILEIKSKDLHELGLKMARLLTEANGCVYTCCDPHLTQAIELLLIESLASLLQVGRDKAAALLPRWKGRRPATDANMQKFVFTLENNFERAQIVHEVYDSSI